MMMIIIIGDNINHDDRLQTCSDFPDAFQICISNMSSLSWFLGDIVLIYLKIGAYIDSDW